MKILVTGGSGFIGGHLVRRLSRDGHEVIAPIRSSQLPSEKGICWFTDCDIADIAWMTKQLMGVDVVVHAAAYAHQTRETTEKDREIFQAVNVDLTARLFRACQEKGVRQFVFISSIGAIRSSSDDVVTELTLPQPNSDYARSKLSAERTLLEHSDAGETALTILRPCLVYGKGNPGNLQRLSTLIDKNVPLPFKSLTSSRSFLYVENLVDAIAACLLDNRAYGKDFIVADDEAMSVPELIGAISAARQRPIRLVAVPDGFLRLLGRMGDIVKCFGARSIGVDSYSVARLTSGLQCDNSKIKGSLDWQPPYSTYDGIGRTFSERA